jgi:rhodanese-related sulfurtransferase
MNITKFLAENIVLVLAAFVSGALLIWPMVRRGASGPAVSAAEATNLANREKGVFIDVSEPAEFAKAHITGSRNIPFGSLEQRVTEQSKDLPSNKATPLILVCPTGARAGKAASLLRSKGYENARVLSGGIAGWQAASMPVEKAAAQA